MQVWIYALGFVSGEDVRVVVTGAAATTIRRQIFHGENQAEAVNFAP